jgi:hypothetical protein
VATLKTADAKPGTGGNWPTVIFGSAVAEHFSVAWYYEAAGMLVLIGLGSWMLGAMRRSVP